MAATYTPIALQEMREVLRSDKGWRAVRDEGCEEHVYEFALKGAPGVRVRVYTSIKRGTRVSRGKARDAIRVSAVEMNPEQPDQVKRGYIKAIRVHRTQNWRDTLKKRVTTVIKDAITRYLAGGAPGAALPPVRVAAAEKISAEESMRQQAVKIQNGTWTVQNTFTGEHRTFKIRTQPDDAEFAPGRRIISVMTGSDNQHSFSRFGWVNPNSVTVWRKYRGWEQGNTYRPSAHEWFADMLAVLFGARVSRYGKDYSSYAIEGSGKCYRCNRKLTHPVSLETGIGPVCATRV